MTNKSHDLKWHEKYNPQNALYNWLTHEEKAEISQSDVHLVFPDPPPCRLAGRTGCSRTPGEQHSPGSTPLSHSLSAVRLTQTNFIMHCQTLVNTCNGFHCIRYNTKPSVICKQTEDRVFFSSTRISNSHFHHLIFSRSVTKSLFILFYTVILQDRCPKIVTTTKFDTRKWPNTSILICT